MCCKGVGLWPHRGQLVHPRPGPTFPSPVKQTHAPSKDRLLLKPPPKVSWGKCLQAQTPRAASLLDEPWPQLSRAYPGPSCQIIRTACRLRHKTLGPIYPWPRPSQPILQGQSGAWTPAPSCRSMRYPIDGEDRPERKRDRACNPSMPTCSSCYVSFHLKPTLTHTNVLFPSQGPIALMYTCLFTSTTTHA